MATVKKRGSDVSSETLIDALMVLKHLSPLRDKFATPEKYKDTARKRDLVKGTSPRDMGLDPSLFQDNKNIGQDFTLGNSYIKEEVIDAQKRRGRNAYNYTNRGNRSDRQAQQSLQNVSDTMSLTNMVDKYNNARHMYGDAFVHGPGDDGLYGTEDDSHAGTYRSNDGWGGGVWSVPYNQMKGFGDLGELGEILSNENIGSEQWHEFWDLNRGKYNRNVLATRGGGGNLLGLLNDMPGMPQVNNLHGFDPESDDTTTSSSTYHIGNFANDLSEAGFIIPGSYEHIALQNLEGEHWAPTQYGSNSLVAGDNRFWQQLAYNFDEDNEGITNS